jgi:Rieske 2Fe-2S family protein
MNGQACGPEFPGLTDQERTSGHSFVTLYPSMFVVAHVDYVRTVSLTPLGPEQTRLTAEWLFPAETLAQPGFDLAAVTDFATTVLLQDAAACEMNQRGLRSQRYRSGRLMPQEFDIHRFHTWVLDRIAPEGDLP